MMGKSPDLSGRSADPSLVSHQPSEFLFFLLKELIDSDAAELRLDQLRSKRAPFSATQLQTRILLLGQQLGIPSGSESTTATLILELCDVSTSGSVARTQLLRVIRKAGRDTSEHVHVLDRYERRLLNILGGGPKHLNGLDGFTRPLREVLDGPVQDNWLMPLVKHWPRTLLTSPVWNSIESPVPDVPSLPIESAWVDLSLSEISARSVPSLEDLEADAWADLYFDREGSGTSLRELLYSVKNLDVVIGLPGAGKSTLIKWIARHIVTDDDCPFGIPAVVSLRHFAREKEKSHSLTLREFFFASQGITEPAHLTKWKILSGLLLDPSRESFHSVESFFWLLDGWDEVPPTQRDMVLSEIRSIASYPGIITTRQSGDPLTLPVTRIFEVRGLQYGASLDLAQKWLRHAGREEYFLRIETALESPDLKRMARSPFLLTLFCALASKPNQGVSLTLKRRSDLLREVIRLVVDYHNRDPRQTRQFQLEDERQIAKFSYWLFSEARGGPRYVFDSRDYETCGADPGVFDALLKPSRLLASQPFSDGDYQFLHANFQEFLAADYLLHWPDQLPTGLAILNPVLKEVTRFLLESVRPGTDAWTVIWARARKMATKLDRYGLVASQLALWIAAADQHANDQELLGINLREELWRVAEQYANENPKPVIEAFLELAPKDFARRILERRLHRKRNDATTAWLERISIFDLEMFFSDNDAFREILTLPEVSVFCPDLSLWIANAARGEDEAHDEQAQLRSDIEAAVTSRDIGAVRTVLWKCTATGFVELASDTIQVLSKWPYEEVKPILLEIALSRAVDDITRGYAVANIVRTGERRSRQRLLSALSGMEFDDAFVLAILGNLIGSQLNHHDVELVYDFLRHSPDAEIRSAAAELVAATRSRNAAVEIMASIDRESDETVRVALYKVLLDVANDAQIGDLWEMRDKSLVSSHEEAEAWFRALLKAVQEHGSRRTALENKQTAFSNFPQAIAFTRQLLQAARANPAGQEAQLLAVAFDFPEILGDRAVDALRLAAETVSLPEGARLAALRALGASGREDVVGFLISLLTEHTHTLSGPLKRTACRALGELNPEGLLKVKTVEAKSTMAQLAFRRDILFIKNTALKTRSATAISMRQSRPVNTTSSATDIAVVIVLLEEAEHFKRMISKRYGVQWDHDDHPTKTFTFYRTELLIEGAQKPLVLAMLCTEEMGAERAANGTSALLEYCNPRNVVVIGIAGSIDRDVLLADVVVPNEVNLYLANSAGVELDGHREFGLSGNHFRPSADLVHQLRQIPQKYPDAYKQWEQRGAGRVSRAITKLMKLKPDVITQFPEDITNRKPRLLCSDHHLASGPTVAKSDVFAAWLQKHDRKAVVVEMETGGAFDALATEQVPRPALSIRGVSDFGDNRKNEVQSKYQGVFRRISMQNATDLFLLLIETGVFDGQAE